MSPIDLALPLTKEAEGLRLHSYQDVVGVWTIGYGTTGRWVQRGLVCTAEQAQSWLLAGIWSAYKGMVVACPVVITLPYVRQAALIDWTYNLGVGRFRSSTLRHCVSDRAYSSVPAEIRKWRMAGGRVLPALIARREKEVALWLSNG